MIKHVENKLKLNIAKNKKDEYVKNLTTSKLIVLHEKIPTNNMIKSK